MKYPRAVQRPLGTQTEPTMAKHDIVLLHTMVGNLNSTDVMFHKDGYTGTESHFGVGGVWGADIGKSYDGIVFQWQDTSRQADAELEGNPRCISIETADNAPQKVEDIAKWTPNQVRSIVQIVAWACMTYDIPPVLIPDSKPGRRGIGYHRQGCEHSDGIGSHPGWLVAGGERWSLSLGKGCPGPARIAQLQAEVIPAVQLQLLIGDPFVTPEEFITANAKATAAATRAAILDLLSTEKFIPNLKSTDDVERPDMTPERAWSLADQKLDLINQSTAAILAAVSPAPTT